ncbi:ATP-dependent protease [Bermanella marisrubri]|uniref:ATP-dependent protease n=1 Tax=Bermanella marisrubri TaxID=207949 RepID=Q1N253_9GAMM|nr:LON peptidase substrate-binding domain-containing protein [Bermanella marisrubri]EAT12311.1 ATP-dependent protease [Bermanella marisrubri]QIZ85399.1 ATP-dependent protease [Bermanella marisrubri]
MNDEKLVDIALFPIPECAVFPGTVFPLHVFEPRYRTMVKHCLDNNLPLAVCHTEKLLHEHQPEQDIREALQSNQDTYKPYAVFGAGHCKLVDTTTDGRLLINVLIEKRYEWVEEVQTLPFMIAKCRLYKDKPMSENEHEEASQLQDKILHRLMALSGGDPSINDRLASSEWVDMPVEEFSFKLFSVIRMNGDVQQAILEMQSPRDRLKVSLDTLNQIKQSP